MTDGWTTAGWTVIDALVSEDEVAAILARCHELCELPAPERSAGDRAHGGTHHLAELDRRIDLVAEVVARPALTAAVTALVGSDHGPVDASYRSPQPGFGAQQLHADDPPKLDDGPDRVATAIVALVEFTETNGSTRVVDGSHRRPDLQRRAGSLPHHPQEHRLIGPAGAAFVFSGHLLHSGTENRSDRERPALQLLWRR